MLRTSAHGPSRAYASFPRQLVCCTTCVIVDHQTVNHLLRFAGQKEGSMAFACPFNAFLKGSLVENEDEKLWIIQLYQIARFIGRVVRA